MKVFIAQHSAAQHSTERHLLNCAPTTDTRRHKQRQTKHRLIAQHASETESQKTADSSYIVTIYSFIYCCTGVAQLPLFLFAYRLTAYRHYLGYFIFA